MAELVGSLISCETRIVQRGVTQYRRFASAADKKRQETKPFGSWSNEPVTETHGARPGPHRCWWIIRGGALKFAKSCQELANLKIVNKCEITDSQNSKLGEF